VIIRRTQHPREWNKREQCENNGGLNHQLMQRNMKYCQSSDRHFISLARLVSIVGNRTLFLHWVCVIGSTYATMPVHHLPQEQHHEKPREEPNAFRRSSMEGFHPPSRQI
jgi:hypothetical protein